MKVLTTALFVFLGLVLVVAGEREVTYHREKCVPIVRDFLRRNSIRIDADFPTNRITHWRVHFEDETGVYLSRLMLERRYAFMFIGNDAINGITHYYDKASSWNSRLMDPKNETEMRSLAAQTNSLNDMTALELARKYFRLQGHDESNFHPVRFKQMIWAWDIQSRRITLPFYEAEWARRDVKLPIEENESIYPSVTIIVSGLQSNLVVYSKIALPVGYGADWEHKQKTETERRP